MTSAFLNHPQIKHEVLPLLDAHERSLAQSAFSLFSDPFGTELDSTSAVHVIVRTLALTLLTEPSATRPTPLSRTSSGHLVTADGLRTIDELTREDDVEDDFRARLLDWCRRQGIDPDWARQARPVYRISRRAETPVTDPATPSASDVLSPIQRIRRLCRAAAFPTVDDRDDLLVRADAPRQTLLDRLVLSIASHEPHICVRATDDFPQASEAWHRLSLTLDCKRDIYRRQALLKVADADPYPEMCTLLGLSLP